MRIGEVEHFHIDVADRTSRDLLEAGDLTQTRQKGGQPVLIWLEIGFGANGRLLGTFVVGVCGCDLKATGSRDLRGPRTAAHNDADIMLRVVLVVGKVKVSGVRI